MLRFDINRERCKLPPFQKSHSLAVGMIFAITVRGLSVVIR